MTTFRNFLRPKDLIRGHTSTQPQDTSTQPTHKTLSSQLRPSGDITRRDHAVARVRKRLRLGSTLTGGSPLTEASHHPPSKVAHQRLPRMPYLRSRRGHSTYKPGPRHHDGCLPQQPLRHRQPGTEATTQGAEPSHPYAPAQTAEHSGGAQTPRPAVSPGPSAANYLRGTTPTR